MTGGPSILCSCQISTGDEREWADGRQGEWKADILVSGIHWAGEHVIWAGRRQTGVVGDKQHHHQILISHLRVEADRRVDAIADHRISCISVLSQLLLWYGTDAISLTGRGGKRARRPLAHRSSNMCALQHLSCWAGSRTCTTFSYARFPSVLYSWQRRVTASGRKTRLCGDGGMAEQRLPRRTAAAYQAGRGADPAHTHTHAHHSHPHAHLLLPHLREGRAGRAAIRRTTSQLRTAEGAFSLPYSPYLHLPTPADGGWDTPLFEHHTRGTGDFNRPKEELDP